jgi:hypothetical protein
MGGLPWVTNHDYPFNPERVAECDAAPLKPRWGICFPAFFPQGSRSARQPWAILCKPFGLIEPADMDCDTGSSYPFRPMATIALRCDV